MGAAGGKCAGGAAGTVPEHGLSFQPPGAGLGAERARCSSSGDKQQGGAGMGTLTQEGLAAFLDPVPTTCVGSSQKTRAGQPHPSHSVWG